MTSLTEVKEGRTEGQMEGRAEEFEQLRPLLFAIAYRILGSVSEAEDAVQETWLRYEATPAPPTSTKAFLSAVVTRIAIDVLRSARVRREAYVGPWLPEPLVTDPYQDPERAAELADSVSLAALASVPVLSGYSISKAAEFSLSQSLRALLARRGVQVHAVMTGPVDTDMIRGLDIPKTSPQSVARGIFDGVENGEEEIFPDPMSEAMAASWRSGAAKTLERQNATLVGAETDKS